MFIINIYIYIYYAHMYLYICLIKFISRRYRQDITEM